MYKKILQTASKFKAFSHGTSVKTVSKGQVLSGSASSITRGGRGKQMEMAVYVQP